MTDEPSGLLKKLRESNAKPRSWHRFMQLWPEVQEALNGGYAIRDIHSALAKGNRWSSGYEAFRLLVARARQESPAQHGGCVSPASCPPLGNDPQRRHHPYRQAPPNSERARRLEAIKRNPLHEPRERDPYDYSGMDPKAKELL